MLAKTTGQSALTGYGQRALAAAACAQDEAMMPPM